MRGHTLIELTVVLLLGAGSVGLSVRAVRSLRDRTAAVAARESLAALVASARSVAMERGGARLGVDAGRGVAWVEVAGGAEVPDTTDLTHSSGVEVSLGGTRTAAELAFDPLGLGRFASATFEFRRGAATTRLVVSTYGRLRREGP